MDDEYVEAVLAVVESVPPGRAVSYGVVAEVVAGRLGRGGPRQVARTMALHGGGVPWWRVVTAAGRLPPGHEVAARRALAGEGCPMAAPDRVDLARAGWWPGAGELAGAGDGAAGAGDRACDEASEGAGDEACDGAADEAGGTVSGASA